jgi:hypothetical protein
MIGKHKVLRQRRVVQDDACFFFSAYPVAFRRPGRCCFYATYDTMAAGATEVRKTPSWPRSWANFSLL